MAPQPKAVVLRQAKPDESAKLPPQRPTLAWLPSAPSLNHRGDRLDVGPSAARTMASRTRSDLAAGAEAARARRDALEPALAAARRDEAPPLPSGPKAPLAASASTATSAAVGAAVALARARQAASTARREAARAALVAAIGDVRAELSDQRVDGALAFKRAQIAERAALALSPAGKLDLVARRKHAEDVLAARAAAERARLEAEAAARRKEEERAKAREARARKKAEALSLIHI